MTGVVKRNRRDTDTDTEGGMPYEDRAETGVGCHMLRNAGDYQKLAETGKLPPWEGSEGTGPCQHIDFGFLAFRTVTG